ncbi:hypothetical protein V8F06_008568 [Rhypophila decipiens]
MRLSSCIVPQSHTTERRHPRFPLAPTPQDGHLDNITACPAERVTVGNGTPRRPSSTHIPPLAIGAESGSTTRENSPTRYEEYRTTLFGRKHRKTEEGQSCWRWEEASRQCATASSEYKDAVFSPSSRRHRGVRKSWRLRPQGPTQNQFIDEDGYVELPHVGRLARSTATEKKELDEAIRLSKQRSPPRCQE